MDLKPDTELLALYLAIDRRKFYALPAYDDPDREAAIEARDERDITLHACPRNKLQKYTAPASMEITWPEKQSHRRQFDKEMAYHQTLLAHVIRPIDQFVLDILGDKRLDDEHLEELLAFASDITNYIQDVSHRIGELRRQNIERALGFEPRKGDRTATESITERKKLLNTIRRKFNTNQRGRGNDYGNSRSYSGRNNQQHNQGNNSSYNQTQQSSSNNQNDNGNGNRDFYNAQSASNRGRGRRRDRGQQPNNPQ